MKNSSLFQVILMFVLGIVAVVAVLIFSGILPGASSALNNKKVEEVVLWGPYPQVVLTNFIAEFNKANEQVVKIRYEARAPETYLDDLIESFARASGPDLFVIDEKMLNRLTGKTAEIPYTGYPQRDILNTYADGVDVYFGLTGLKAVPLFIDPLVMYYNRTMYSSAGLVNVPKTWDEFVSNLPKFNQVDDRNNVTRTGAAMGEFRNITNAKNLLSAILFQAGNPIQVLDDKGRPKAVLDNDYGYSTSPAIAALSFYQQFSDTAQSTYSWNRSMVVDKNFFLAENLANYFGMASDLGDLRAKNPHLNIDVSTLPQKDLNRRITYGNVYALALSKGSKKKVSALNAALALSKTSSLEKLSGILSMTPARRDLLAKKEADPFKQIFKDSAVITKTWADPDPVKTNQIFSQMSEESQIGQSAISSAIMNGNGKINLLFEK